MSDEPWVHVKGATSERDWEELERRLRAGEEPAAAARAFHRTLTDFRRTDAARHAEMLRVSREARGYVADRVVEDGVVERDERGVAVAFREDASDSMRQFWARRWQPAYAASQSQVQVDVSGEVVVERREVNLTGAIGVLIAANALDESGLDELVSGARALLPAPSE